MCSVLSVAVPELRPRAARARLAVWLRTARSLAGPRAARDPGDCARVVLPPLRASNARRSGQAGASHCPGRPRDTACQTHYGLPVPQVCAPFPSQARSRPGG